MLSLWLTWCKHIMGFFVALPVACRVLSVAIAGSNWFTTANSSRSSHQTNPDCPTCSEQHLLLRLAARRNSKNKKKRFGLYALRYGISEADRKSNVDPAKQCIRMGQKEGSKTADRHYNYDNHLLLSGDVDPHIYTYVDTGLSTANTQAMEWNSKIQERYEASGVL